MNVKSLLWRLLLVSFLVAPLSCQDEADVVAPSDLDDSGSVPDDNFISLEQASLIAENAELSGFVSNESSLQTRIKKSKPKKIAKAKSINDRKGKAMLHIFDYAGDEGGFSIISADKREMPVLAYSEDGDFDVDNLENLPHGLISWLAMMEEEINALREGKNILSTDEQGVASEWNNMVLVAEVLQNNVNSRTNTDPCDRPGVDCGPDVPPPVTVGPLLTTRWGQDCGYNDNTPATSNSANCNNAPTGCVATAMAQVMRFHRRPTRYNWAAMPAGGFLTEGASPELARLMRDAGNSVDMTYGNTSSGSDTEDVDDALRGTFSYSSASWRGSNYNHRDVESNLNSRRPVILRGRELNGCFLGIFCDYKNGHAWVCDGYRRYWTECCSYLNFHMNWGWNGRFNGWFAYANWNPDTFEFNYQRGAVINIIP